MSIHRSLKFAMSLGKKDLLEKIKENEDLVQLLQEQGPLKTKTIEDLRLTLMTVAVYHQLNM
jgi:homogentisate 1,2-dioxygenase